jgi:hypothetical protein
MQIKMSEEQLDKTLSFFLAQHQGRQNAIDRWTLVVKVFGEGADLPRTDDNLQDRMIRDAVSRLRLHGLFVCDMGDGKGRFIASTEEEYRAFRSSYLKPLVSRAQVVHAMDKYAVEKWPNVLQPTLFDLAGLGLSSLTPMNWSE